MLSKNKFGAFEILEYEVLDSTNEEAKRVINNDKAVDKIVITSYAQTSGRGRGAKEWISDEGNLFFSLILKDKQFSSPVHSSIITPLAVSNAVAASGITSSIKWPNDVLINEEKICGILIERYKDTLIIGVGVNITSSPAILDGGRKATYLDMHISGKDRDIILKEILKSYSLVLDQYSKEGIDSVLKSYKSKLYRLGEEIEIEHLGNRVRGRVKDIDSEGHLIIETPSGIQHLKTGEVFSI